MMHSTKIKLLPIAVIVLAWFCFTLAIKKTVLLKKEYKELSTTLAQADGIPRELRLLSQKKKYYDTILSQLDQEDTSLQNILLRTINTGALKYEVKIMDFNEPHRYITAESETFTFIFDLKGDFTDILKVVYILEQEKNLGEVVHLKFLKQKDYSKRKDYLIAQVFLRHIK